MTKSETNIVHVNVYLFSFLPLPTFPLRSSVPPSLLPPLSLPPSHPLSLPPPFFPGRMQLWIILLIVVLIILLTLIGQSLLLPWHCTKLHLVFRACTIQYQISEVHNNSISHSFHGWIQKCEHEVCTTLPVYHVIYCKKKPLVFKNCFSKTL